MCIRDRIEIELEKEIEIEKEREGETGHPAPAAYGRYNNVILTDTCLLYTSRSREEMRELLTAKANVDRVLKMEVEQDVKKDQSIIMG